MSHALSKATEGAVLLMHDFDRDDDSVNKMVLKSVRSLLARAKAIGIPVLTVQQFCRSRNILT
jgi:hypothetical protein